MVVETQFIFLTVKRVVVVVLVRKVNQLHQMELAATVVQVVHPV
jgi:hypothetical protein